GFYIEAEKMLLIEKDGKKTYIFSGYRYSDDRLRNVAIAEEIDGTFKTYLVDYSFRRTISGNDGRRARFYRTAGFI
ncbi:MAG TPA: hypothetical protein VFQ50_10110, partial [Flavobacterium sp.]|nr:hypothetical protein [Flavobacterium sp.]